MQFGADPKPALTVSTGVREGAIVVRVEGELDHQSARLLRGELATVWSTPGMATVVLDLSAVTFCDSVGLSELIAAMRHSEGIGHTLMISGMQGTLLRILTITGLRGAFDGYDTVEDALRHASPPALFPMDPSARRSSLLEASGGDPSVLGASADALLPFHPSPSAPKEPS